MEKGEAFMFQLLYVTLVSAFLSVPGFWNTFKLLAMGKYLKQVLQHFCLTQTLSLLDYDLLDKNEHSWRK